MPSNRLSVSRKIVSDQGRGLSRLFHRHEIRAQNGNSKIAETRARRIEQIALRLRTIRLKFGERKPPEDGKHYRREMWLNKASGVVNCAVLPLPAKLTSKKLSLRNLSNELRYDMCARSVAKSDDCRKTFRDADTSRFRVIQAGRGFAPVGTESLDSPPCRENSRYGSNDCTNYRCVHCVGNKFSRLTLVQ